MNLPTPLRSYAPAVIAAGERWLAELGPVVDAADPGGRVAPSSRLLCAGLGELGAITHRALGGEQHAEAVSRAGAMLSLLTKVDDQIIDAPDFHGGDRRDLVRRTRAFLAPTLASLRAGRPATGEPRCALAAELGRALRDLAADEARLARALTTIAAGWEVQVEAVRVLTSHPAQVTRAEVARVTRSISGVWLLMIARLGELPEGAQRAITPIEEQGFHTFGWAIQRADALADLAKDLADGHLASWPGLLLWERAPDAYLDAAARGDAAAIHALLRAHDVDLECLPDAAEAAALAAALPDLGEARLLLGWIHDFLARRYLAHPLCTRGARREAVPQPSAARLFPGGVACSAP